MKNFFQIFVLPFILVMMLLLSFHQKQTIETLQEQNQETEAVCSRQRTLLESYKMQNAKLRAETEQHENAAEEYEKRLEKWQEDIIEESQAFHDEWCMRKYYLPDTDEAQYVEGSFWITFQRQSILLGMDAGNSLTDEAVYSYRLCSKEEVTEALSDIGVSTEEITGLLDSDYYMEMDFGSTQNWHSPLRPFQEKMANSRFYPINRDVMLCIPKNGAKEVYIFERFLFWLW